MCMPHTCMLPGNGSARARPLPRGPDDSRVDSDEPRGNSDRYEALPSVAALPAWIWRRLPRAAKVALALLALAAIGLVILLSPGIDESKDERRQAESERLSRLREQRVAEQREEQRPRVRRVEPAGADLAARAALLATVRTAVERDARRRVAAGALEGPIRRVTCERYPRSLDEPGAHLDPGRAAGRYSCLGDHGRRARRRGLDLLGDRASLPRADRLRLRPLCVLQGQRPPRGGLDRLAAGDRAARLRRTLTPPSGRLPADGRELRPAPRRGRP